MYVFCCRGRCLHRPVNLPWFTLFYRLRKCTKNGIVETTADLFGVKKFNIGWYFDGLYLPDGAHETQNGYESTVPVTTVEVTSIEQADGITTLTCAETTGQDQHAELPLLYYPGYTVIEGPGTAFKTANGLVGVTVPANYTGTIRVTYREPKRWLAADGVSVATLAALAVLLLLRRRKAVKAK